MISALAVRCSGLHLAVQNSCPSEVAFPCALSSVQRGNELCVRVVTLFTSCRFPSLICGRGGFQLCILPLVLCPGCKPVDSVRCLPLAVQTVRLWLDDVIGVCSMVHPSSHSAI